MDRVFVLFILSLFSFTTVVEAQTNSLPAAASAEAPDHEHERDPKGDRKAAAAGCQ